VHGHVTLNTFSHFWHFPKICFNFNCLIDFVLCGTVYVELNSELKVFCKFEVLIFMQKNINF
jgi:hypothetical protein